MRTGASVPVAGATAVAGANAVLAVARVVVAVTATGRAVAMATRTMKGVHTGADGNICPFFMLLFIYMKKKIQILIIHGGTTHKTRRDYLHYLKTRKISLDKRVNWAGEYLERQLGKNFQVIRPRMPLQDNAKYKDWEIMFEKYIPLLNKEVILMGNSLGGIFLAKYLSEHKFPKKILATFLTCAPFDNSHSDEDLVGGFKLKSNLSLMEKNSPNLIMSFSADDECVPVYHAEKFREKLKNAKIFIYKGKCGHFNCPTFPEIIKQIKECVKKK